MKCSDINTDLSALLDGELDKDRALEVQNHLSACLSCQEMMELLAGSKAAFVALQAEELSSGFSQRIQSANESQPSPGYLRKLFWVPVAVAASLVFVFILGQSGIRNGDSVGYASEITAQILEMKLQPNLMLMEEGLGLPPAEFTPCLDPAETSAKLGPCGTTCS